MLPPLSESERRRLVLWSVSLCTGALLLAPLAAHSSGSVSTDETAASDRLALPQWSDKVPFASFTMTRDPFTAEITRIPQSALQSADTLLAVLPGENVGDKVVAGSPIGQLSQNGDAPASPGNGRSTISAVITGSTAQAIVDEAGRTRIVSVGGLVDGLRITAISNDGVRLSNGELRRISEGSH